MRLLPRFRRRLLIKHVKLEIYHTAPCFSQTTYLGTIKSNCTVVPLYYLRISLLVEVHLSVVIQSANAAYSVRVQEALLFLRTAVGDPMLH